jgi:hypothetical protein
LILPFGACSGEHLSGYSLLAGSFGVPASL